MEEPVTVDVGPGAEPLRLLQPSEAAELPDDDGVEWAPIAPYWAVLWRSGTALAAELSGAELTGRRVVELGCGLAAPSIVAARAGADVLATDAEPEAVAVARRNAERNGVELEAATLAWTEPAAIAARGPFDLVLAADVLYAERSVEPLLALFATLDAPVWLADPGRAPAQALLARARADWEIETTTRGVVAIHRLGRGA
jgi:predicted nicotinamide N-methyase